MKDTDLKTAEDRIAWFCEHFQVTPPELEYDEEEPDAFLLTDELVKWCSCEGVSLDWLFCGGVAGMAATFRETHRMDPVTHEVMKAISRLSEGEQGIVLEALKSEASMDDALETAREKIEAIRAA